MGSQHIPDLVVDSRGKLLKLLLGNLLLISIGVVLFRHHAVVIEDQQCVLLYLFYRHKNGEKAALIHQLHVILLSRSRQLYGHVPGRGDICLNQHPLRRHVRSQDAVRIGRFRVGDLLYSSPVH